MKLSTMTGASKDFAGAASDPGSCEGAPARSHDRIGPGLAYGGILLILLIPVLIVDHPRMVDLPNHLARHYIGEAIGNSAVLQGFYRFSWQPIPNLAADALYVPLSLVLDPYAAARAILGISIALWLAAPMLLYRVLWGRFGLWPLFAGLVIYNANLLWGFENYLLASAVSLLLFALWVVWRSPLTLGRSLGFALLATGLYLGHLVAFGLLGLLVASYEAGLLWRGRKSLGRADLGRGIAAGLAFLPGALHFLILVTRNVASHGSGTEFGGPGMRLLGLMSPTLLNGDLSDLWFLLIVAGVLVAGFVRWGRYHLHPALLPVVLSVGAFAVITPFKLFGVYLTHYRLPFVAIALLIAAGRWNLSPQRWRAALLGALTLLLTIRMAEVTTDWQDHDGEVKELILAFRQLEEGSRILPAVGEGADPGKLHWHSVAFAAIERNAYVPTLFTGAHLLHQAPAFRNLEPAGNRPVPVAGMAATLEEPPPEAAGHRPYWRTWWRDFSHVLVLDRAATGNPFPDLLEPIAEGRVFILYRNRGFAAASQP